jgi:hypothetical protein
VTIQWDTTDQKTAEVTSYKVDTEELVVVTTLFHSSGQWIESKLPVIPRDASPQGMGSALTYGRRYGLCPLIGIAQADDDGNASSGRGAPNQGAPNQAFKAPHKPQGGLGAEIPEQVAFEAAVGMRELLDMDAEERIKALKVLDRHDMLNKYQDLYAAASQVLKPAERSAWKAYVSQAKSAEKEDRANAPTNGRRF